MTRWLLILLFVQTQLQGVAQPVDTKEHLRSSELVELTTLDSTIKLDIRYATANNFMRRPMYNQACAFLQRPAAEALLRAHAALRKSGYGLLVLDAYRPWSVTKKFWDETPKAKRIYVANPKKGSKHNRGCAVDLTLYDLATGQEVSMPTPYDDFTKNSAADAPYGTSEQRRMRNILREAMEAQGFRVNRDEWWHFDYRDWSAYPILDIPFDSLK